MNERKTAPRAPILLLALVAAVLLMGLGWWRSQAHIRTMRAENERLRQAVAKVEPGPVAVVSAEAPAVVEPSVEVLPVAAAPSDAPAAPATVMTPFGMEAAPRQDGLALAGTHVAPVEGGLRATLRFNPTTQESLGSVALVVRLPRGGTGRILALEASGPARFAPSAREVSPDGTFAVFHGTPQETTALEFALTVSEPTVADVRGTTGIGPYDLRIEAAGATAQPK